MTHRNKALTFGTAAFLATAVYGGAYAQSTSTQPRAGFQNNDNNANNANAAAQANDQHHTQQLIAHGLNMVVNGSDLQLAAQSQGRYRQGQAQGDGQDRNRNADNRNENNANNNNDRNNNDRNNNANAENRRNANAGDQGDRNQERQAQSQQTNHQLRLQAWRQFEGGQRLLREANTVLNAEGNNANANARDDGRNAWSRRLYSASEQYATTLRSLSGVGSRAPEASGSNEDQNQAQNDRDRDRAGANQNQNQGNRSDNNQNQNANGGWRNRTEAGQVALLNHAVREAIEAFELNQAHHQAFGVNRAAAINASAQRLQEHARQMASESQQIVQQVLASLTSDGNQDQNRDRQNNNRDQNRDRQDDNARNRNDNARNQNDNARNRNDNARNQNDSARNQGDNARNRNDNARNQGDDNNNAQNGQASVRVLAQQAQQVIETLQRINPAAAAPAVAPTR